MKRPDLVSSPSGSGRGGRGLGSGNDDHDDGDDDDDVEEEEEEEEEEEGWCTGGERQMRAASFIGSVWRGCSLAVRDYETPKVPGTLTIRLLKDSVARQGHLLSHVHFFPSFLPSFLSSFLPSFLPSSMRSLSSSPSSSTSSSSGTPRSSDPRAFRPRNDQFLGNEARIDETKGERERERENGYLLQTDIASINFSLSLS